MALLDAFRRGWGWVWLLGAAELALIAYEARPLLQPAPPPRHTTQTPPKPADSPARVSLQPILDFQPFGTPDLPPPILEPETPVIAEVPPSPVTEGYVLQGVLFREDGVPSRAILAWNGATAASYTAGDTLPSGATLAGVEANRVWLEKDGDRQFLEFPVSGSALPDQTGTDPSAEPDPANPTPAPNPAKPVMPQPDLRNLIPGLTAAPTDTN